MDSELVVGYLKEFHQQTKHRNDKPRVLMVDGHTSHCGLAFLTRAVELNIFMVSYPPCTTHTLQGLNAGVFSSLKHHRQLPHEARFQGNSLPVRKEDLLVSTCGDSNTQTQNRSIQKTGAHPINHNTIRPDQMAPIKTHNITPGMHVVRDRVDKEWTQLSCVTVYILP